MPVKPGYQTSEFALTILSTLVIMLNSIPLTTFTTPSSAHLFDIILAGITMVYTFCRTYLKKDVAPVGSFTVPVKTVTVPVQGADNRLTGV